MLNGDLSDARRDTAVMRVALAEEELALARAYRDKLLLKDFATGLTLREVGNLYNVHFTTVQAIVKRSPRTQALAQKELSGERR